MNDKLGGNATFHGKYRGTVINNIDPMKIGRLMVQVPDVLGLGMSTWAMACVPFSGPQMGMWVQPQIGAGVWVEFEGGDPDFPIWTGCWWGSAADPPALAQASAPGISNVVIQTKLQNLLQISDNPGALGGILLKTTTGAMISVSDVGIIISNGKGAMITLTGPTVTVNQGALTIT